jgi:exodeoxyribonuclease V gamma subunit
MHLYSAARAEDLAVRLAGVLVDDPLDPMESEWMAVPSDGMRRWVNLELARHLGATRPGGGDGVVANFVRAYPGTLRDLVLDAASRHDGDVSGDAGTDDPWQIDRMVWSLLAVFDDLATGGGMPEFTELAAGACRFTRVRTVADLFDRYHLHRPEMIRAWADADPSDRGSVDGSGQTISTFAAWQPRLWRLLRREIASDSPPERMGTILEQIRADQLDLDDELPSRLILFGFTSLPGRDFLPLIEAVARRRDVHLFLLGPHRFDLAALLGEWPHPGGSRPRLRSEDPTGARIHQPLLRSWGRLPRESALLLADGLAPDIERLTWVPTVAGSRRNLLERLQDDILADAEAVPEPAGPDDRTVQFHSCFGPMRQVQVARDAILHLLNDPESELAEEDVLVVCPSLETFAPLVEAVFGPSGGSREVVDGTGAPFLRYRIADRSIRSANPVLGATAALLDLVSGRFEVARVLDFLSLSTVRERFGFDDGDLAVFAEWAVEARVRWGLDPGHRAGFGVPETVIGNTWQGALDRLLIGTAVADADEHLAVGEIAPFGVDTGDVEILGALAFIVGRLAALTEHSIGPDRTVHDWAEILRQTCSDLFAVPDQASWQFDALERVLREIVDAVAASRRGSTVGLDLLDVRRLLEGKLDNEPGRPDFFRGGVTVTSMASLRWVPFRVVCILGLDQDTLSSSAPDAADLVAAAPQVGDPDPRSEARQWLLEAVLATRDHLVIVREGRDVRSNHPVPQVVPAAELFDAVVALVPEGDRTAVRESLEVTHPRHPFDEECLVANRLVTGAPWSFAARDLDGATRRRLRPPVREPFLEVPLDRDNVEVVELEDLRAFLRDPVATFVRRSLEADLPRPTDEIDDILPVDPDGLETHRIGQDLLDARLQGIDDTTWRRAERAKGALPPGVLEDRLFDDLSAEVADLLAAAAALGVTTGDPIPRDVDVTLAGGIRIVGTIPLGLDGSSPGPGRVQFTRPKHTHRLEAWLDLMVLVASDPNVPWRSVVVTRAESRGKTLTPVVLEPAASDHAAGMAAEALALVVGLYGKGLCEPLPLFSAYSPAVHNGASADGAWKDHNGRGDGTRPAVRLVFGDVDVDEIDDMAPRADDPGATGNRVERYAHHLWGTVDRTSKPVA